MRGASTGIAIVVAVTLAVIATAARALDVPYLSGRVVDEAEILSAPTRARLTEALKAHEGRTTNQVVVLTVTTLEGESVEAYAERVFDTWKLGQKGKDNGVLVLVAPNERRMRIEVGYGLEGTLTDVEAARIIRNAMTPRFKTGDFDGGVLAGLDAILARLEGRSGPVGDARGAASTGTPAPVAKALSVFDAPEIARLERDLPPWPMRILLGAFIFGIIGLFTVMGVLMPGVGWFLYVFLIPFWAMFPIVVVGVKGALALLATYLVGFPIAKLVVRSRPEYAKADRELRRTGRTTFGGVVISSGGGGGSGGSSGGGFSGGGGSSGGGGASGSW